MLFGINNSTGKTMKVVEMGLNANLLRREVIADNIANVDTPFFKRSEVSFESQLRRAVDSEKESEFPTLMTDKKHIPFDQKIDFTSVKPKVTTEFDTIFRNDKNNVDIDKEMMDSTKNALHYNALLEVYSRNIRILDTVIR